MMKYKEPYGAFLIVSNNLKENLLKIPDSKLNAISARIADSIRETESKIRAEFEKDQNE